MDSVVFASLRMLADNWKVLGIVAALLLVGSRIGRTRQLAVGLAVPLGLVVYRRFALLIPVPGALSTSDSVTFWSTGSCIYFLLLLIAYGGVIIAIFRVRGDITGEHLGAIGLLWFVAQLVLSALLLPLDGWTHLSMPLFTHFAVIKILLVHPLLLDMAVIAAILQLLLFVVRWARPLGRELNKLLILLCVLVGVFQLCLQFGNLGHVRSTSSLRESWFDERSNADVADFFGQWSARLEFFGNCGLNLVEGDVPVRCLDRPIVGGLSPWAKVRTPDLSSVAWVACFFIVVAIAIERLWPRDRAPGPLAPSPDIAAIGAWVPIMIPSQTRLTLPRAWVLYVVALAVGTLVAIWWGNSVVIGALAVILGLASLSATGIVLLSACFDEQRALVRFILDRDLRGSRSPGRTLRSALGRVGDADALISTLPTERLSPLLLVDGRVDARVRARIEARTGSLRRATWLTRLDWACSGDTSIQGIAASSLPSELWPRAVLKLQRSENADARLAALRSPTLPRTTVLRMCLADSSQEVRRAAWEALRDVSAEEASLLAESRFDEIRAAAVRSRKLTSNQMMVLAEDSSAVVRQAAWEVLAPVLTKEHARRLYASRWGDVRCRAIESGRLDRSYVLTAGRLDSDETVRAAAVLALAGLSAEEALSLSRSTFADVRMRSLRSGTLSMLRIKDLCTDEDSAIRETAYDRARSAVTAGEAAKLSRSQYADVRLRAVNSGLLSRDTLGILIELDTDRAVRQAAWLGFFQDASSADAERVIASSNREIRPAAARIRAMRRETRVNLCAADWQRDVRQAAWEMLQASLTPAEAQSLARSVYADSRSRAIQSARLPRQSLVDLCASDTLSAARRAAREQLGYIADIQEAMTLASSPFADCRLYAVQSDMLPAARLRELVGDPDSSVRSAARERLAAIPNQRRHN